MCKYSYVIQKTFMCLTCTLYMYIGLGVVCGLGSPDVRTVYVRVHVYLTRAKSPMVAAD